MNTIRKRLIALGAAAAIAALALTGCASTDTTTGGKPCLVDDKDRTSVADNDGGTRSVYRVYTSCGVFNIEDAPFLGRISSADLYAGIKPGHRYLFETYGFRMPIFSDFPNITEATEVR